MIEKEKLHELAERIRSEVAVIERLNQHQKMTTSTDVRLGLIDSVTSHLEELYILASIVEFLEDEDENENGSE